MTVDRDHATELAAMLDIAIMVFWKVEGGSESTEVDVATTLCALSETFAKVIAAHSDPDLCVETAVKCFTDPTFISEIKEMHKTINRMTGPIL